MRIQGIAQDAADRNTWKRIADNALKGLHTHTFRGQVHEGWIGSGGADHPRPASGYTPLLPV